MSLLIQQRVCCTKKDSDLTPTTPPLATAPKPHLPARMLLAIAGVAL
jgi:hypothetical protein